MVAQLLTASAVGFGTTGSATATSASFTVSALAPQVGDVLLALIHDQFSGTPQTITAPSGWTAVGAPPTTSGNGSRISQLYYYPIPNQAALTALGTTVTWSFNASSAGRLACVVARMTGVDTTNPVDTAQSAWDTTHAAAASYTLPAITTKGAGLIVGALIYQAAGTAADPATSAFGDSFAGYQTSTGATISRTYAFLGAHSTTAAATNYAMGYTANAAGTSPVMQQVSFTAATAPSTSGLQIGKAVGSDGTTQSACYAKYVDTDGVTLKTPGGYKAVPKGYASAAAMIANAFSYCAHRGGSLDWPEMSMQAYGMAALTGYGALEVSVARTSDGVFFGLHDASLDRTSLGTGGGSGTQLVASTMTWAQVQAQQILGSTATNNPTQPNRPYMRLDQLLAMYGSSHVLFIDPKVIPNTYLPDLVTLINTYTTPARVVAKSYGVSAYGAGTWKAVAKAAGYTTWGYFYEADSGNFATYQAAWDWLGLDYNASSASWSTMKGYGKPVLAHILPNAAALTTAKNFGANGAMVSGINAITPT